MEEIIELLLSYELVQTREDAEVFEPDHADAVLNNIQSAYERGYA